MKQSSATSTLARMTAGRRDIVIRPRNFNDIRPTPIIYCNSSFATPAEAIGKAAAFSSLRAFLRELVDVGYAIFCPDLDLTWGSRDDLITDAVNYAASIGCVEPPIVMGASHGGACALHWGANNDPAAVVGIIPAVDMETVRELDTVGVRAVLDAAWGVTYPTPLPAGADVMDLAPNLVGTPTRLYCASDDEVSINHAQFAAASGAEDIDVGALGHTNAALEAIDTENLINWLEDILTP